MSEKLAQTLFDKRALDELICAQALAVDTRDWIAFRNCLADVVDFHFPESMGPTTDPDQWVENAKSVVPGFDATMHTVTNFSHKIEGDEAQSQAYVVAKHFLNNDSGDREISGGGIYTIGSIRTPSGWKIKKWRLKNLYWYGNRSLYQLAMENVRLGKTK